MSNTLWNDEWPAVNTGRAYPLVASCSRTSGAFRIPDSLITDLQLTLPRVGGLTNPLVVHIRRIVVMGTGVIISIGYRNTTIATVNVPAATSNMSTFNVTPAAGFEAVCGVITIGSVESTLSYPGVWTFDVPAARIEPTLIHVAPNSVQAIKTVDATGATTRLTGEVVLSAGTNVRIRVVNGTAYIDALSSTGDGYGEDCNCNTVQLGPQITKINGISPDANGNFTIAGVGCADIKPASGGIVIEDTCASPCCGCAELDAITARLASMDDDVDVMRLATSDIQSAISGTTAALSAIKAQN